jgi:hypothetical protein
MPILKRFADDLGHEIKIRSWVKATSDQEMGTEAQIIFSKKELP